MEAESSVVSTDRAHSPYSYSLRLFCCNKKREDIRAHFNKRANALDDYSKIYMYKKIIYPLDKTIHEISKNIDELVNSRNNKNNLRKNFLLYRLSVKT